MAGFMHKRTVGAIELIPDPKYILSHIEEIERTKEFDFEWVSECCSAPLYFTNILAHKDDEHLPLTRSYCSKCGEVCNIKYIKLEK